MGREQGRKGAVTPLKQPNRRLRSAARALAFSPRVPFEVRSRLLYWSHRRSWPTRQPVTFNQKLLWKMTKDRSPLLTTFADKVAMRDYVAGLVGRQHLTDLYDVVEDPDRLDPNRLPETFVVKPNHASGMVWFVDRAHPGRESYACLSSEIFRSTRDGLDWELLRTTCRRWLGIQYSDCEQEWAYRKIVPRILVEELLEDLGASTPPEYKLFVLNGTVRLLKTHFDRFGMHRSDLVLPDGTLIATTAFGGTAHNAFSVPVHFDRMIAVAEALARETDFLRVDIYDIDGRIVVGELTSYPGGPQGIHDPTLPPEVDTELGRLWAMPKHYIHSR